MVNSLTRNITAGRPLAAYAVNALTLLLLAAIVVAITPGRSQGQLRSGSIERPMYRAEPAVQAPQRQTRRQPAVVSASYTAEHPYSILDESLEGDAQNIVEHEPIPHISSGSRHLAAPIAPDHSAGCGCDDCHSIGRGFNSGCSCGSSAGLCNDVGCRGRADFCELAPTCAAACPPGCGPLMALWCRMSVRGESPLYWRRAAGPPALVTTSPAGTAAGTAGELGRASTSVLLGDAKLNEDLNVGARITLSTWIDQTESLGLLFRYWNAGDQDDTFNFSSDNHAILARPFFNTTVAGDFENDTQLVAFPGELAGSISVATESAVDGLEISLRRRLYQDRFTRVDWLYGYQHVSIDEGLVISSNTNVIGSDTMISVTDGFHTENSFHGVTYGFMSSRHFACWKMESLFRLGAGNLRREVNIAGSTTTASAGQTSTTAQGLLARNTNSRNFVDDTFVVVPEVGINFAYCLRPGLDFNVGYNYMLVPKVAQASQQIRDDLAVNLSNPLTGTLDPQFTFDERSYWLHSLGLGLQLRY